MKTKSKKNLILILVVIIIGSALIYWGREKSEVAEQASSPLLGQPAPIFELADKEKNIYSSDRLKGKNILLFFNEGLSCYPACWDEMLALAKDRRFEENNTLVLSVVADTPEKWLDAIKKMPELGRAKIVFDKDLTASRAYGMLNMPSAMHRGSLPGHTYVLIDQTGTVKFIYDDIRMGKNGDKLINEIKKEN